MGHEVKQPRRPAAHAEGEHHVAELADGRIGEHPLDVVGHQGDRRRDEQRDRADVGDHEQHVGGEHRIEPPHEIHARRHHRCRVHERRHGRGALHRIGKPHEERKLRALAHAAAEDADPGDEQQPAAEAHASPTVDLVRHLGRGRLRHLGGCGKFHHAVRHTQSMALGGRPDQAEEPGPGRVRSIRRRVGEVQRPERPPQGHEADQHAEVADTIDDERLVGGCRRALPLVVEADQKPGADAHELPEDEHHRQIAGDHDPEHREAEQRQRLKKPWKAARTMQMTTARQMHLMIGDVVEFVVHVARGIDVDAGGDEGHHHEHQHRERVDIPADRELQAAALVKRVPIAGIGHRDLSLAMAGGVAAMAGGLGRMALAVMPIPVMDRLHRMRSEPDAGREQREHKRRHDRRRRHPGGVAAMRPHARPEKQDRHERGQRGEPRQTEEHGKLGGDVHGWRAGPFRAQPLRSSARSTSTVEWLL